MVFSASGWCGLTRTPTRRIEDIRLSVPMGEFELSLECGSDDIRARAGVSTLMCATVQRRWKFKVQSSKFKVKSCPAFEL
jgi:hypothetical protein